VSSHEANVEMKDRAAAGGRPREFDLDEALDRAMLLFWRKGYEGASLSDLTEAVGVARPSLYAAFGPKDQLFLKALDRYDQRTAGFLWGSIAAPTAREVAEGLLRGAADFHNQANNPPGCLMVHGALVGSDASDLVRLETRNRRALLREAIEERLKRAQAESDLAADCDPRALARYIVAVMRGMAVEAASGASGEELREIVDVAINAWPRGKAPRADKGRSSRRLARRGRKRSS
jgi:AcrR family transcriptional regulator